MEATLQTVEQQTPSTFAAFKAEKAISFIRAYDPKVQNIAGYRHATIRYRDADKKAGTVSKPAKMVTIPAVSFPEEYSYLPANAATVLLGVIEDQQDVMIREAIESGVSLIDWATISLDSCLSALTAVRTANYLTKEQIEAWVSITMREQLEARAEQISDAKNHNPVQRSQQIAATYNQYRDGFCKLAAKVPSLGMETAQALQNQLTLANLADDMAKKLSSKLHKILNPAEASDDL